MIRQIFYGLNENQQQASMIFRNGVSADEAYKLEQRFELLTTQATSGQTITLI